jgi:hypothetical protein
MAKSKDKSQEKFIAKVHKFFSTVSDVESAGRRERLDDVKFVRLGEQWPESVKRDRERPGAERPMLTINRLFQFRNQVINEIRQNRPSIKVRPVDDKADVDTAEVLQGIIRHIQDVSNASIAYDTAAEWQVDTGLGYFRAITKYCDPDSFDQDIEIKQVVDPFKVYFDSESTAADGSDATKCIIVEEWSRDEFERLYPDADVTSFNQAAQGDSIGWYTDDTVRVAEYFEIDIRPRKLAQLRDGSVSWSDEIPDEFKQLIVKERMSEERVCKWYKIAGNQIVEETELPTSFIPVFPVYGSEVWIEGKRHLHGLTRHAKDPARLYNFFQSANAETLALAPKAPYIAAEGQLDGYEAEWQNANRINVSVLTYNPVTLGGNVVGPPRREAPPSTNPGFEAAMNRAELDIKATMGMFDAAMGNHESNQSGKAILSQQRQSSTGNFHFADNLSRSIQHAGRVIIEMIPKIYDAKRIARMLGEDGTPKSVTIDPSQPQAKNEVQGENGQIQSIYNLGIGKYDVVVETGPSYATKRMEAAESMMQFVQADPAILQVAGDLIVSNMDWPGAQEIAKRMKAMLPPQVLQAEQGEEGGEAPDPQVVQQMNQMADQVEHLSQELQAALKKADGTEDKLDIERFNAQTKRLEVEHKIALESTDLFHKIAAESAVANTLAEPNDGEAEDIDDATENEEPTQATAPQNLPGGMQ